MEVGLAHDKGAFEMSASEMEVEKPEVLAPKEYNCTHLKKKPAEFREIAEFPQTIRSRI